VRIARARHAGTCEAGIRTLVGGYWGFARTGNMTEQGIENCVAEAVSNAARRSNRHQYDLRMPHELWRCALLK
jgi:predicted Zn-dependent protease